LAYEKEEVILTSVDIVNNLTGEITTAEARHVVTERHYSIKKLNAKVAIMDLFTTQEAICSSKKDISIFRWILLTADKNNQITINISALAKQFNVSRTKMSSFINSAKKEKFIRKIENQIYEINPFLFKAKGATNSTIEQLQKEWDNDK